MKRFFALFVTLATVGALVFSFVWAFNWSPYGWEAFSISSKRLVGMAQPTEIRMLGKICNKMQKYACSESVYADLVAADPRNTHLLSILGHIQVKLGKRLEAIETYNQMIAFGGGGADSYFHLAKSLSAVGNVEEAVKWHYRSMYANDRYIDNVAALIEVLAQLDRAVEALSVIGSYTALYPKAAERFRAYEPLLAARIEDLQAKGDFEKVSERFPEVGDHFYAPLRIGDCQETGKFMVDTGAAYLMVPKSLLKKWNVPIPKEEKQVSLVSANEAESPGVLVTFPLVKIGSIRLRNVKAVVCGQCSMLLGQSVLRRLKMETERLAGVHYLQLSASKLAIT